ncbi:aspartic proteinase CDR1-like [Cornus florida]|uniref:aspartic proteinase CDR1-like n=1 Tax=Cornus florida TaxID=4283 RepID=UPI0028A22DEE|nr:aspartic proteinase CDR1-like [Cornus florida]
MLKYSFLHLELSLVLVIVVSSSSHAAITRPHRLVTKLIHRDSVLSPYYNPNATTLDLARWATESSVARSAYLRARTASSLYSTVDVRGGVIPIVTGIIFLVNFSIGEPPVSQLAAMDTGSILLWIQCLPCTKCFDQLGPIFDPSKSSTYDELSCASPYCDFPFRCDKSRSCRYGENYYDNTSTNGGLALEKLTFLTSDESTTSVQSIVFGCGHINENKIGKFSGVLGLGNHVVSLPSQLGSVFSYCIGNINDPYYTHNQLIIGNGARIEGYSTPMTIYRGLYYLTLEGISVGQKRLDIDPETFKRNPLGRGGVIIDSGMTDTLLVRPGFEPLKAEVQAVIGGLLRRVVITMKPNLLCYRGVVSEDLKGFPVVTFHFAGGADLVLDIDNMFQQHGPNAFCMAVFVSDDEDRPSAIGIMAQQYYNIGYDLSGKKLYFQRIDCELLED